MADTKKATTDREWPPGSTGRYATRADVAYYFQVSERWVQDARDRGLIRANKISHKVVRFDKRKIEAWAEATLEKDFSWDE